MPPNEPAKPGPEASRDEPPATVIDDNDRHEIHFHLQTLEAQLKALVKWMPASRKIKAIQETQWRLSRELRRVIPERRRPLDASVLDDDLRDRLDSLGFD